jgi:conjugative relaxase-like TrwC/TraI family protein
MIFINHQKSATAAKDYYTQHIAPGDGKYYTEENAVQMRGLWHGRGAEMLHLSGEVKQEDFFRLCDNLTPDGKKLTARTDDDRRVMADMTFDAPKAVTLAYELGGDDRILEAFRQSVRETMAEIEGNVQTRVRKKGANEDRLTGNMIWAEHIHRTARPVTDKKTKEQSVDPQLHCHATVFNATFDSVENRWKAIQLGDIVRDKGYYQAAFHARLAHRLSDLGYGVKKDGSSFTLAGIDRSTIEKFSRRSGVIDKEAERLGITDSASKSKLGRRTREKKSEQLQSMEELSTEWFMRLTSAEREILRSLNPYQRTHDERVPEKAPGNAGDSPITPDQAKEYALEHSFERSSAVSEKRLQAEALMYGVGSVKPEDVADIAQHPEVISRNHDGQLFTTTKSVLKDEVATLQFAKDGQRKRQPFIPAREYLAGKQLNPLEYSRSGTFTESLAGLSEEQQKAALHILNSRDTVTGLIGKAGAGKTTTMRHIRDAIDSVPGQHVFAFAPSSQASRGVLAKEGFKDAETVEMLLKNEKLQERTKGQVLWIDEAGLLSSKTMRRVTELAKRNGNRIILSGDWAQHSSVEAGDSFRLLEKEGGVKLARLTEIRRQTEPGYKKAVEQIAEGSGKSAQKGFDALDRMGCVIEASGEERHQQLVRDYLKAQDEGASALIISPTHAEGQKLTDEVRTALKERGALGEERPFIARKSTGWTQAEKSDVRNYQPDMVLEWSQNARGFKRGEKAVVIEGENGLELQKQDGNRVPLPSQTDRFDVFRTRQIGIAKGDRIRITRNGEAKVEGQAKGTRINNGDIFTVEGFTKEGDIRLEKGRLLPKSWGHMSLGYVDTSYASQGKTTDRVFISVGNESLPAANQQQWYVSASRGRQQAKLYVASKEDVREAISRTGERLSAVELTHTRVDNWRTRFYKSLERNRVSRFLTSRANALANYWQKGRGKESYG